MADHLSHLFYAFGNVAGATPDALCHLADPWADYQNSGLPSVSGQPYANWPFGNFGALIQLKQLHPGMKILRIIARLNVGGPARHVVWLSEGLKPLGYETVLVAGVVPAGEDDMN